MQFCALGPRPAIASVWPEVGQTGFGLCRVGGSATGRRGWLAAGVAGLPSNQGVAVLAEFPVGATLPTDDPQRLRTFYEGVLGFRVRLERPGGIYFQAGEGTYFGISKSSGRASGTHTQMGFAVSNIEAIVKDLRERGVVFEEYEIPKTVDGIARVPAGRSAWFRDPDGNLVGMIEFDSPTDAP
jgi:catechol 2,3-dioxygenase-like lactoylglutathione lyase family enzyme